MRQLGIWAERVGVGFVRSCVVAVVTMLVPTVWVVAMAWAIWWGAGNPWSWLGPFVLVCVGTLGLSRPVCRMVRSLVARWTGTFIPAGYREAGPVVRMSTGYWWNGFTYERSRRDAVLDQKWRVRWKDPAVWRDVRFTGIVPFAAGVVASVQPVGVVAAALVLGQGVPAGVLGLVVSIATAPYAWRLLVPVAVRFLRPSRAMTMTERVEELTAQRADATVAQAAEIRRIERDLHDGAQARLVALGLALATAEKLMENDPDQAKALMREARGGAAASLAELRELVKGISPPVLNERGLVDAVRALALDVPLDVAVSADAGLRLDPPIEAAFYFGVAELLTNAVRHAQPSRARISLSQDGGDLIVEVEDDGRGGAEVRADGGLAGLRRRLAIFDGTLELSSPPGGPTRVRMALPCDSL
ncbi:Histidine kinase-, DNA gyrase B-, and HSP90-like ATPase [Nonomuraea maritima]|uniref:histidine kinase n=1 Tax=Nonomuraea maritima TaxID=683260 RepID=A0A1G9BU23_9ACTN|nr:sensor histidine kinase [Nonomuraea maritima]SDK42475.1 Histidine kinase-, DNA gyrase B-, and HSP90-like ATPase [Nonomuraea maritima]